KSYITAATNKKNSTPSFSNPICILSVYMASVIIFGLLLSYLGQQYFLISYSNRNYYLAGKL
ncbi:MAG TPA: hypothetical protein VIJ95_00835, partial [Hanamia sp.]